MVVVVVAAVRKWQGSHCWRVGDVRTMGGLRAAYRAWGNNNDNKGGLCACKCGTAHARVHVGWGICRVCIPFGQFCPLPAPGRQRRALCQHAAECFKLHKSSTAAWVTDIRKHQRRLCQNTRTRTVVSTVSRSRREASSREHPWCPERLTASFCFAHQQMADPEAIGRVRRAARQGREAPRRGHLPAGPARRQAGRTPVPWWPYSHAAFACRAAGLLGLLLWPVCDEPGGPGQPLPGHELDDV